MKSILLLALLLIPAASAISVSMSNDAGSISQDFNLLDSSSLKETAFLGEDAIVSQTETTGQGSMVLQTEGGDQKFAAGMTGDGFSALQIATLEGVGGNVEVSGTTAFTDEEVAAIASGQYGKSSMGLTDSGYVFHYTSLPYFTGSDPCTPYDSSDAATIYVKNEARTFNGITITGLQLAQDVGTAANTWNTATGHQYVANVYYTSSYKANFNQGNNGVNSVSWADPGAIGQLVARTDVWFNAQTGVPTTVKIGLNPWMGAAYTVPGKRLLALKHELGHGYVGILDTTEPMGLMNPNIGNYQTRINPTWDEKTIATYKRNY